MSSELLFRLSRLGSFLRTRVTYCCILVLLAVFTLTTAYGQTQGISKPEALSANPQPAVNAILSAFDKYEVVAMPAAHGLKDLDDVIFSLVRNPEFPNKVNDIEMECGNSLYQPILDRYIAGENVPFTEVRKVWRNTTQPMCGLSGFVEEFYPLVRAINQKLPPAKRIRVLAADPPIDWDQVKSFQDFLKYADRDASIASVMEREVLAKHRKALMLFGTFHILHGMRDAVSAYEKDHPKATFVIAEIGVFTSDPTIKSAIASWPSPSLVEAKGTWIGASGFPKFYPPPMRIDQGCHAYAGFPEEMQRPVEKFVDAFLYVGPSDLMLKEPIPADIALDVEYIKALRARGPLLMGKEPATMEEFNQEIISGAEHPLFSMPEPADPKEIQHAVQDCLERRRNQSGTTQ